MGYLCLAGADEDASGCASAGDDEASHLTSADAPDSLLHLLHLLTLRFLLRYLLHFHLLLLVLLLLRFRHFLLFRDLGLFLFPALSPQMLVEALYLFPALSPSLALCRCSSRVRKKQGSGWEWCRSQQLD